MSLPIFQDMEDIVLYVVVCVGLFVVFSLFVCCRANRNFYEQKTTYPSLSLVARNADTVRW